MDNMDSGRIELSNGRIEDVRVWFDENAADDCVLIQGKFLKDVEEPYFDIGFVMFSDEMKFPNDLIGAEIVSVDLSTLYPEDGFFAKLVYLTGGNQKELNFMCREYKVNFFKKRVFVRGAFMDEQDF